MSEKITNYSKRDRMRLPLWQQFGGKDGEVLAVVDWARDVASDKTRVAICGMAGDYDLPGWDAVEWRRTSSTYGKIDSRNESIWFSPACLSADDSDVEVAK